MFWRHFWSWETNSCCRVRSPTIPGKSCDCQQQFNVPRIDTILIALAGCTPSDVPMAESLAPTPPPRILRKMPSCHQLSALMRLTCFFALIHQTCWLKPIDRGCGIRYQPCHAVVSLRDTPPKAHLCALPECTNFRLSSFTAPSASTFPGLCSFLTCSSPSRAGRLTP